MPLTNETTNQLRASGWSEEKIASVSKRKDIREENNRILDTFIKYYSFLDSRPDYEDCEIEREHSRIFVLWYEPEHMRGCLSPRTFHVVKVDNSYAFEEV